MKRIQRKRIKGWRMPPNTIFVGRPTKWGNPYPIEEYGRSVVMQSYKAWIGIQLDNDPDFLEPLRGKDLACWCRLDQPCHVDILLELLRG